MERSPANHMWSSTRLARKSGEQASPNTRSGTSQGWDVSGTEAVLATLVDSVACGVLLFGASGELFSANNRFAEMFQMDPGTPDELANFETMVSRLTPRFADCEAVAARWRQRFRRDEASWDELELQRPERRIIEHFARPVLDGAGRRLAWIEIYRDVSTQRIIEQKLLHTQRMAAIGQMVSGIAHELNNPLTSILGYAQLSLTRRCGPQRDTDVQRVLQQAERASRIAKNLLLLSRDSTAEHSPVDLNEVVERTIALRSYELRLENIHVGMDLSQHLPQALGDAGQLQQVLLNLIVNAEQAIQHGKGEGNIWLRTRQIARNRIALEVADDGPGIAPELLSRIFDPFFTTKAPGVGTGLGLSIVYGIVHDHSGEVSVDSREGNGTTFTVELRAMQTLAPEAAAKTLVRAERPAAEPVARSGAILVVEDEPTVAQRIADVLGEEGHPVDMVLDSREGLELIRQKPYELVICDLRMPHLDGRGFYRELVRQASPLAHRLIFVTGDTLGPRTVEFLEASGVPYLAKPFLVEELKEVVYNALAGVSQPAASRSVPRDRIVAQRRRADDNSKGTHQ